MNSDAGKTWNIDNQREYALKSVRERCSEPVFATRDSCAPIDFLRYTAFKESVFVLAGVAKEHVVDVHAPEGVVFTVRVPDRRFSNYFEDLFHVGLRVSRFHDSNMLTRK